MSYSPKDRMGWFAFHRKSYKQAMLPTCAAIQNSTPCWQISCNCFSFASLMMWSPLPLNSLLPFHPNNHHADHFSHLTSPAPFAAMSKMTLLKIIKIQGITWDFGRAISWSCGSALSRELHGSPFTTNTGDSILVIPFLKWCLECLLLKTAELQRVHIGS